MIPPANSTDSRAECPIGRLASGEVLDTHFPWEVVEFGVAFQRDVDSLMIVDGGHVK